MANIYGTAKGEVLNGTDAADGIYGYGGADFLFGGAGNDYLSGGADDDYLVGGSGADFLYGGIGNDTVSYATSPFPASPGVPYGVIVDLAKGRGYGGDAEGDVLVSIENVSGSVGIDELYGNEGANKLYGNGYHDRLFGRGGDDMLYGGDGADELSGGEGADQLFGGANLDAASYRQASSGVVASLTDGGSGGEAAGDTYFEIEHLHGSAFADILTGDGAENYLLGNGGNDTLHGKGGNDKLWGDDGDDALNGGGGADSLVGGFGIDVLTGGSGADVFYFANAADSGVSGGNRDRITDFSHTEGDKIDIGNLAGPPLDFIGTANFSAAGQVGYSQQNDYTIVRINLQGSTGAEMEIRLDGTHNLTADDFIL